MNATQNDRTKSIERGRRAIRVSALAARMISEIEADEAGGVIPKGLRSFSELHDHVDANEYGGLFEPELDSAEWDALVEIADEAQTRVSEWMAAR